MNANFWGTSKPPPGTALNIDFIISQKITDLWPMWEGAGRPYNLIRRISGAPTGTLTSIKWSGGRFGSSIGGIGTAQSYVNPGTFAIGLKDPNVWTYFFAFRCDAVASANAIWGTTDTDNPQFAVGSSLYTAANTNTVGIDCHSTINSQATANNNSIVQNRWYQCVCVRRGSAVAPEIWLEGSKLGLQASGTTANIDTSVPRYIGGYGDASGLVQAAINGQIAYLGIAGIAWDQTMIRAFQGSPFGMLFAPPGFRRYFVPRVVLPQGWQPEFPDFIPDPVRASVAYY